MQARALTVLLTGVVALIASHCGTAAGQQPRQSVQACVLETKRMCCAHESVPAIKEMSKIPGVARVVADHKTRSLTIITKENAAPSPLAIWEAAERTKLEPVRLTTALGVYNAKPTVRR